MKFLFCPLASHGFVYPAIAVALELRGRGHEVAFVTGPAFAETLHRLGIERIPRGATDGPSFEVHAWYDPLSIAMQVKHIELGVRRFAPDVIVSHPLSLGALIVRERLGIRVAVLGLMTHLWPASDELMRRAPQSETERRLVWRHGDMLRYLDAARALFGLAPSASTYEASPMLGDLFLLQSTPELDGPGAVFPERVHRVGSCLWEPPASDDLVDWLDRSEAADVPLLYVQHGRSFDHPGFWDPLVEALGRRRVRVAAAVGRMDRSVGPVPERFFIAPHLAQGAVLRRARAAISGGTTTPVLGALTHGVPSLIVPDGNEQFDIAEQVSRAGAALHLSIAGATAQAIDRAVDELLERPELTRRAHELKQAFAAAPGPLRAATLIEELASTAPAPRASAPRSHPRAPGAAEGSCR